MCKIILAIGVISDRCSDFVDLLVCSLARSLACLLARLLVWLLLQVPPSNSNPALRPAGVGLRAKLLTRYFVVQCLV